ncbi:hypothetical protein NM688_g5267 [Phlebia brevispora]|uniref:Uncharacterized protein n=1 Tax=Phlebia brevispora TaxID=194682 RepID=A0ACC1SY43_9APHY|nr:hypothetical protein NM688_g5267 [Phlebia brevispora]
MDYAQAGSSRDPMELERLAEELAVRESKKRGSGPDTENHDLPVYIPLSHDNPHLAAETFNVEEFLLSRLYTSLPDLRSELRDYLATLKEELVKLINDDYEAFISLSTDLRGEGARLERLKLPLGDLRAEVLASRNELQRIQDAIQLKLEKRSALREEKVFLQLLLKISESVTRLESLLLIASPSDNEHTDPDIHGMKLAKRLEDDAIENRSRGNQAKHLARVASEYTQLLYHVSKARTDKCAFVDECQWRIDRIRSTLSSDLDHLFSTTLIALVEGKEAGKETRATEADKVRWLGDVTECLRIYDILGLWGDAEEVIRTDVVREFTIHPGALAAPHSPIVPHTPSGVGHRQTSAAPATAATFPRTPYTPFSAFASKQNPFETSFSIHTQAHLLDDADDPLAALYNTILRFVDRDMRRIMEIAEKVSVKTASRMTTSASRTPLLPAADVPVAKTKEEQEGGFEIMANVVWGGIGKAIMDDLGSIVFAAGNTDDFRKHHETTQAFIRSLEFLAPSVHAVEVMRAHPVYIAFERRWQLPVYFQLRWKEIVPKLEESLAVMKLERTPSKAIQPFVTTQAAAVWEAIATCWSAEVYIPDLNYRFWRLTLQLISRYHTWLQGVLPALESSSKPSFIQTEKLTNLSSPNLARSSTPSNVQAEASSPESIAADDVLLGVCATALIDIKAMEGQIWNLWREEIGAMMPDISELEDEDVRTSLEGDTLRHALSGILSFVPPISSQIIIILSRRGCDALLPMRSIPSQFRAMSSSKRLPTEASHFVALIFRSLKAFFGVGVADGPGSSLKDNYLKAFSEEVFEIVAQRYIYFLTAMKKTEESLRRLKKGKRSAFSLFGSSSTASNDDGRADEEKIRRQMVLDVEAFGKDARTLGVAVDESATYRALKDLANANLSDE